MRELYFALAVWGTTYVDTMLSIAIPSFLAPGNIPACASLASVRLMIITRPEDAARIKRHPVIKEVRRYARVDILPLLTPDEFEGNRYSIMARAHRYAIKQALWAHAILSIPAPDHVVADGSFRFGLQKILEGYRAVNMAGPRAILDELRPILTSPPYCQDGKVISIAAPDLVTLLTKFPHAISRLLYWNAEPFSAFPSALYWAAGQHSLLTRYFHLHPIFVDLTDADAKAGESDSIDGSLLTLANISPQQTFNAVDSNDLCFVELSSNAHDPMGSVPSHVADKVQFMETWARSAADPSHIDQFKKSAFRFSGRETLDWDTITAICDREMDGVFRSLDKIATERRQEKSVLAQNNPIQTQRASSGKPRSPIEILASLRQASRRSIAEALMPPLFWRALGWTKRHLKNREVVSLGALKVEPSKHNNALTVSEKIQLIHRMDAGDYSFDTDLRERLEKAWFLDKASAPYPSFLSRVYASGNALIMNGHDVEDVSYRLPYGIAREKSQGKKYETFLALAEGAGLDFNGAVVADVGASYGFFLEAVGAMHPDGKLMAVALSKSASSYISQHHPQLIVHQASLSSPTEELKVALGGPVDIVVCKEVLQHLEHPELALRAILVLQPRRGVALIVPNGRADQAAQHIHFWSPESWKLFVEEHSQGWTVIFDRCPSVNSPGEFDNMACLLPKERA